MFTMKNTILHLLFWSFLCIGNSMYAQTGNVGIGTTTPTEKLEVNGNIKDSSFSTTWTPSIAYDSNYMLIYEGNLYRHLTTTNTASAPSADATNWRNITAPEIVKTQETLTITSTGTAPTKATSPINDYITATDDGTWVTIDFEYSHTNNTGTAVGSGEYLFELPAGYAFNTSVHPVNTQSVYLSGAQEPHKIIHLSGFLQGDINYSFNNYVVPYDATHFRIINMNVNAWYFVGYGCFIITHPELVYKGSFRFQKM